MKTIYLLSLGCPRNLVDSEVLQGLLEKKGFTVVEEAEGADVAIVNTCGFIQDAKAESIDAILQLAELKKDGKVSRIIVTGCLSQRYPKEITDEIREIDGMFGTADFTRIPEFIDTIYAGEKVRQVSEKPAFLYDEFYRRKLLTQPHSAYVKIQEGCSNKCSYCVIPDLKGPHRSRTVESVVREAKMLRDGSGLKELLVIGQDTTSFGIERTPRGELPRLLAELSRVMEGGWVRLMYTHPVRFTDELIEVIASRENICKYVDLPIQHISDRILRDMNRGAKKEEITGLIGRIRGAIDGVVIRTSVIVGFPGETEAEFRELADYLKEIKFDRLGAFVFSREEGTKAAAMKGQVSENVKKARLDEVMRLQQGISAENNLKYLGSVRKVLIDERGEDGSFFIGRGEMDAPEVDGMVYVRGAGLRVGEFSEVKINGTMEYDLSGEAI